MARFTLTVPDQFLKEYDETIKNHYTTRNAAILEAMKEQQQKLKKESAKP